MTAGETLLDLRRMGAGVGVFRVEVIMGVVVAMRMVTFAVVMVMMAVFFAQAHDRPDRHADDDEAADEQEVGLGFFDVPMGAVVQRQAGEDPDDERMREGGAEAEQGGLPGGAPDRDDEGRHHRLGVAGLEAVQGAEEDGDRDVEPSVGGALLQQLGEVHAPTLAT